jgi:hypothetical protein
MKIIPGKGSFDFGIAKAAMPSLRMTNRKLGMTSNK